MNCLVLTPSTIQQHTMLSASSLWKRYNSMYKPGRVYVNPPIHPSRVKDWLKDTEVEVPFDPLLSPPSKRRAMEVNTDKVNINKGNISGEAAEDVVAYLMKSIFQDHTLPSDPAVLILKNPKTQEGDVDLMIFHRKCGVILVQVKGVPNPQNLPKIQKAVKQLLEARKTFCKETESLLRPQAVTLVAALPNIQKETMPDPRNRFQILQQNPEVEVLCGTKSADYLAWLRNLPNRPDDDVWGSGSAGDEAFATAVSKKLSLSRLTQPLDPGDVLRQHSDFYRNWIMTPDQAVIQVSQHPYLHIWGPPGAGKTLLLLDRAIRWLKQGKTVVIIVGNDQQVILLGSLGRAALYKASKGTERLKLICGTAGGKLQKMLDELLKERREEVCLIADEAEDDLFQILMVYSQPQGKSQAKLSAAWSANMVDFSGVRSTEAEEYKWVRINLPKCLRCPKYIVQFAASLVAQNEAAMEEFDMPLPRSETCKVRVINHLNHQQKMFECQKCENELQTTGIPFKRSNRKPQSLSDWVVLLCGTDGSTKDTEALQHVLAWLRKLNLNVTWEGTKKVSSFLAVELHTGRVPLNDRSNTHLARRTLEDRERERIVVGQDRKGRPVVHLATADSFQGLEKPGILMVHFDPRDGTAGSDVPMLREQHRRQWLTAATRCQGELVVLVLSPSPVADMLTKNPHAFMATS